MKCRISPQVPTHWNCVRMKRASSLETALVPEAKKRKLIYATFSKWKVDMDKEGQTGSRGSIVTQRSRQARGL